jgi:hypothetical protein
MDSYPTTLYTITRENVAKCHPIWLATTAEREAMEKACVKQYFNCKTDEIPESSRSFINDMKGKLHNYVFGMRYNDVPEKENRWEWLIDLSRTKKNSENSLSSCLHKKVFNLKEICGNNIVFAIKNLTDCANNLDKMAEVLSIEEFHEDVSKIEMLCRVMKKEW